MTRDSLPPRDSAYRDAFYINGFRSTVRQPLQSRAESRMLPTGRVEERIGDDRLLPSASQVPADRLTPRQRARRARKASLETAASRPTSRSATSPTTKTRPTVLVSPGLPRQRRPRRGRSPSPLHGLWQWLNRPVAWQRYRQLGRSLAWSLLWVLTFCGLAGLGIKSLEWLTRLPEPPNCAKITFAAADAERLFCAREAAKSGHLADLTAAVNLVAAWPADHPLYREGQSLLAEWSAQILDAAEARLESSGVQEALSVVRHIPSNSPLYAEAQAAIAQWQAQWQQGEAIWNQAQEALRNQDWNLAAEQVTVLGQVESEYWRTHRMEALTRQILQEQTAHKLLTQAQQAAGDQTLANLQAAIALVQQIDPQTLAWETAQADLQAWSGALLDLALRQWQAGDRSGALALAQQVPPDLVNHLTGEGQNLLRLAHAQRLIAEPAAQWLPSLRQVWSVREAIAALSEIPASSAFYAIAQTELNTQHAVLDDLRQLQTAGLVASLGQRTTLDWASRLAQQIAPDRPRRLQAQTLAAHWQQETQRIQDMPQFLQAQALAQPGHIADLQAAIAAARQIPRDRALWTEAEQAIATWSRQIQTLEDRPILEEATRIAQSGDLSRAIRTAEKIGRNRTLHAEAQAAIQTWNAKLEEVRIAEDRKHLDEARALAARVRLSQAIDTAAQIARDRPLYAEAQAAIAQWRAQRDEILASRRAQEAEAANSEATRDEAARTEYAPAEGAIAPEPYPAEPAYVYEAPPPY
ncbi:hypothetical protein [Thermoleptolyngbya sp. M55_K2018_002]|uniref:hypothetical protein n=1 Tax=Thermoleptolyngbya sp. M55_K2018_002 TaxID=2747808 RepID=UPI0019F26BFF|nr:hypothetical protein [Thermoleptolyngbya sp. M55_K2018_002]HIK39148.1 hypothetical protein [Thermoleptolyngbya sp. M55_K2018_002]